MTKAAVVILAGTDGPANLGRVVNGLEAAREFDGPGDDVRVIFDGAATGWVERLEDPDHDYHDLYASVKDDAAACDYCASAFGAEDAVEAASLETLEDHEGHPSIRSHIEDDYEIITY